jgi:cytochrome c553
MEWPMKRLVTAVIVILVLIAIAATGCTNKGLVSPSPEGEQEVVSTCVTCHTDKDTLKELATTEEVVKSEETTGEG